MLNPSQVNPKPITTCSNAFSRAWRRLHVPASSSDWFIGLSASVVIGQSDFFQWSWVFDTRLKTAQHSLSFVPWLKAYIDCYGCHKKCRLRVVPHFSHGSVNKALTRATRRQGARGRRSPLAGGEWKTLVFKI